MRKAEEAEVEVVGEDDDEEDAKCPLFVVLLSLLLLLLPLEWKGDEGNEAGDVGEGAAEEEEEPAGSWCD